MELLKEDQLVLSKVEHRCSTLDPLSVACPFGELLQLSLQRLSTSIYASDASCAPSTIADSMTGSCCTRKRRQDASDEASVLPLVQSLRELAKCRWQLVFD